MACKCDTLPADFAVGLGHARACPEFDYPDLPEHFEPEHFDPYNDDALAAEYAGEDRL